MSNNYVSLQDFYRQLVIHDWLYYMSDDHRVYSAGKQEGFRLAKLAETSEDHYNIYQAFSKWIGKVVLGEAGYGEPPKLKDILKR